MIYTQFKGIPVVIAETEKDVIILDILEDSKRMSKRELTKKYKKDDYTIGRVLEYGKKKGIT